MTTELPPDGYYDEDAAIRIDWSTALVDLNHRSTSPLPWSAEEEDDARASFDYSESQEEPVSSTASGSTGHKKRGMGTAAPSRRKKKLKSLPKRPLSAYNFFFQKERSVLMKGQPTVGSSPTASPSLSTKVGFEDLGRIVGTKWRMLPESERESYKKQAVRDSERYRREMEDHKRLEKSKKDQEDDEKEEYHYPQSQLQLQPTPQQPLLSFPPAPSSQYPPPSYPQYGMQPVPHHGPPHYYGMAPYMTSSGFLPERKDESDRFPLPHGVVHGPVPPSGIPLRPNQEVLIPDQNGQLQKYRVHYAVMSMTESAAKAYMHQFTNATTPPPPHHSSSASMPHSY